MNNEYNSDATNHDVCFSLPAVCFTSAIPSMCSIGLVTPSTYTLKMAVSGSSCGGDSDIADTADTEADLETDK